MGSGQAKAAEYYDSYMDLCNELGLIPRNLNVYEHSSVIAKKLAVSGLYECFRKIKELKEQGWDLDHIKDFHNLQ